MRRTRLSEPHKSNYKLSKFSGSGSGVRSFVCHFLLACRKNCRDKIASDKSRCDRCVVVLCQPNDEIHSNWCWVMRIADFYCHSVINHSSQKRSDDASEASLSSSCCICLRARAFRHNARVSANITHDTDGVIVQGFIVNRSHCVSRCCEKWTCVGLWQSDDHPGLRLDFSRSQFRCLPPRSTYAVTAARKCQTKSNELRECVRALRRHTHKHYFYSF